MNKSFQCTVATPEGIKFDEPVERVTLQTEMGEITILANHEPLVGLAVSGTAEIVQDKNVKTYQLGEGVIEVEKNNRLSLLINRFEEIKEK